MRAAKEGVSLAEDLRRCVAGALVFAAHQPLRQARRYARFKGALTATLGTYAGAMPPYTTGLAMETGLTTATGLAITG